MENAELLIEHPATATPTEVNLDALVKVAKMLSQSWEDIATLWEFPIVHALISKRKLKLNKWLDL